MLPAAWANRAAWASAGMTVSGIVGARSAGDQGSHKGCPYAGCRKTRRLDSCARGNDWHLLPAATVPVVVRRFTEWVA